MGRILGLKSTDSGIYLLLSLFIVVVFGPICALIAITILYCTGNAADVIALLLPAGRRLDLLISSVILAGTVAVSATGIGILAGSLLWEIRTGVLSRLRWLVVVLVMVPAFLYAQAWITLFAWLHVPGSLPAGLISYWVQLGAFLPLGVVLGILAMASVDPVSIEAARIIYPDIRVFWRIILPIASPALGASVGLIFLLSITDYSVPSLFSLNVYALEIFSEFSASSEPARALLIAVPLLAVTMAVLFLAQGRMRNLMMGTSLFQYQAEPPVYPRWFVALQHAALGLLLLHSLVLVSVLVLQVAAMPEPVQPILEAGSDIVTTFMIALVAALCSLPLAYSVAARMSQPDRRGRIWWFLCIVQLALPAPLVGIGLIAVWNHPTISGFYGTLAMPVLAAMARFTPIAALIILVQLRHCDPLLTDAARVFQRSRIESWIRIRLPLLAPGLLAAACVTFALSAGELGATLLVIPPGMETVTIRIYNYLHYGSSGTVAGLGLVMMALMLLVGGIAIAVVRGWVRLMWGRPARRGGDLS